jgi:hypothetical protein
MATNSIDEALKQVLTPDKPPAQKESKAENNNIISDRSSIVQDGYLDGLWMSQDYILGLEKGLSEGISLGRKRLLNSFRRDLTQIRQVEIAPNLTELCGNFPKFETKTIFQLPGA